MPAAATQSEFRATLLAPRDPCDWAFVVLPLEASEPLPRRGRTSVTGTINGHAFTAQLEPDGQKSHWLKIEKQLLAAAGACAGEVAEFTIRPVGHEPEPAVPTDLLAALESSPGARTTWEATTTIARVDWIHWIVSAKQAATRTKRINDACEMLASGKKRVCCFDPSGFYSKALKPPVSG